MNWLENVEIEKLEVGHPRNGDKVPLLNFRLTPHEGEPGELAVSCRFLTAAEFAGTLRGVAAAIDRWGEERNITKDNLEAMIATGALPPEARLPSDIGPA